jgi:hypothetical protein
MTEASLDSNAKARGDFSPGMFLVRYGLGGVMVLAGVVMLIVSPASQGVDGFAMAVGGGLSVVLLNFLFRLSVSSEEDRAAEERARAFFDEHGEWPEDEPRRGRQWVLPAGVVTYEQEQEQLRAAGELRPAGEFTAAGELRPTGDLRAAGELRPTHQSGDFVPFGVEKTAASR